MSILRFICSEQPQWAKSGMPLCPMLDGESSPASSPADGGSHGSPTGSDYICLCQGLAAWCELAWCPGGWGRGTARSSSLGLHRPPLAHPLPHGRGVSQEPERVVRATFGRLAIRLSVLAVSGSTMLQKHGQISRHRRGAPRAGRPAVRAGGAPRSGRPAVRAAGAAAHASSSSSRG